MRVVICPSPFGSRKLLYWLDDIDLQPAEDCVNIGGARDETQGSISPFGLSEPSEKQEQIAFRETAPLQVRVGGPRRAEDSLPAFSAAKGVGVDIGV